MDTKRPGQMFERYSESARRAIFFARFEAAEMGSEAIESGHLLLGILRDHRGLAMRILTMHGVTRERVERCVESRYVTVDSTIERPLSAELKRVLQSASVAAENFRNDFIDSELLLLGLLCVEDCRAAVVLHQFGLRRHEFSEFLAGRPDNLAWRRCELVVRLGFERAYESPFVHGRRSDAERQEVEELLARDRAVWDGFLAASARNEFNEAGVLYAEQMDLRERLRHLLVD